MSIFLFFLPVGALAALAGAGVAADVWLTDYRFAERRSYWQARAETSRLARLLTCRLCLTFWLFWAFLALWSGLFTLVAVTLSAIGS